MDDEPILPRRLRVPWDDVNATTYDVIGAAIEVQNALGTGLLESAYKMALAHELSLRGRRVRVEAPLDVRYRDLVIPRAYFIDLVVDELVAVELKRAAGVDEHGFAQLATYLRFGGLRVGLLVNFRRMPLKSGIHRVIAADPEDAP